MGKKILVLTGSPRKKGNSFAMTGRIYPSCGSKGTYGQAF